MTRKEALAAVREAGERDDPQAAMAVWLRAGISLAEYRRAWAEGQRKREKARA